MTPEKTYIYEKDDIKADTIYQDFIKDGKYEK